MSDIKFSCPACGQHISIDASYAGEKLACPNCQGPVTVPSAPEAAMDDVQIAKAPAKGSGKMMAVGVALLAIAGVAGGVVFLKGRQKDDSKEKAAPATTGTQPSTSQTVVTSKPSAPEPPPVDPSMDGMAMGMNASMGSAIEATPGPFPTDPNPWPQWRGPNRDGISPEKGLLQQWPLAGPKLVWKASGCGKGFSSVSVSGGKIFTMGDGSDGSHVHCFEESTGKKVWSSPVVGKTGGNYAGTKSTPTVDGNRVYALGQFGDLVCLNTADGKIVWRKSLTDDFAGRFSEWNYTESPLIDGERLIICPGGRAGLMVALNKSTGAPLWRTQSWNDDAQYVSPVIAEFGGRRQYVTMTMQNVGGVSAETGQLLWKAARAGATAVIPSPIIYNDMVYVTSGYNIGCHAFKIGMNGPRFTASQVYWNKELINHHGGVVLVGKHVYGHSDRGGWTCMDIETGEVKWKHFSVGKGAALYADGRLYCRAEAGNGAIALVEANPDAYREVGRFDQPDRSNQNSWAHLAIANGRLLVRDQDVLLAYDIRAR